MLFSKRFFQLLAVLLFVAAQFSCSKNETEAPDINNYFKPQAAFSYSMKQVGNVMRVDFVNTTLYKDLYVYKWEFGDNNTATTMNASHDYVIPLTKPEAYNVVLTATDTISNTFNRVSQVVTINPVDPR
ncbi:MAG: PKD domain-containing protein [Bacteroidales bacterium]|nr:PKD domain-containing protein [Bacteroidales bacterium]